MTGRRPIALAISLALACAFLAPVGGFAKQQSGLQRVMQVPVTFRLLIAGQPTSRATFWVAYGPTAGKFGIIRLTSQGNGWWTVRQRLPAHARLNLAYLMGQGTVHTRFGPAPGNPVVTIRREASFTVGGAPPPAVEWQAPVG